MVKKRRLLKILKSHKKQIRIKPTLQVTKKKKKHLKIMTKIYRISKRSVKTIDHH